MESKSTRFLFSFFGGIAIPLSFWLAITPLSGWLDLETSHLFFEKGDFSSFPLWKWLYVYGIWPAWGMMIISFGALICSIAPKFRQWLRPSLFLILTMGVGSGLIIHGVFKDHWGRPRPRQVIEFGGNQPFRPYYEPNFSAQPEPSKSFTCGHCSLGFTFFSLALLGAYYRSRLLLWLGWILAWGLGILLSAGRIAQGGHFLTDTLASALIMWITAWCLAHLLLIRKVGKNENSHS